MRKPYTILLCLFYFLAVPSAGQDRSKIDSLVTQLSKQSQDSVRCRIMFDIAIEIRAIDTILALEYLESAKQIATELNDTKGLGRYNQILGKVHAYHGNYKLALLDYDRALAYYSEAVDNVSYFETIKEKGNVYLFMAEYSQAMNLYSSALDFYQRNDMAIGMSRCLNNMGIIHKNRGEYVDALLVYEESVIYLDTVNDAYDISQAYINMGNVFVFLGSYELAIEYFEKALEIAERENFQQNIAVSLSNSGVVQNKCNNYHIFFHIYHQIC